MAGGRARIGNQFPHGKTAFEPDLFKARHWDGSAPQDKVDNVMELRIVSRGLACFGLASILCFSVACSTATTGSKGAVRLHEGVSTAPTVEAVIPCANGQERGKAGNCPPMPPCPKRCYLGGRINDPKSCGFQSDPAPSKFQEYQAQRVDGKICAWTFPPGTHWANL